MNYIKRGVCQQNINDFYSHYGRKPSFDEVERYSYQNKKGISEYPEFPFRDTEVDTSKETLLEMFDQCWIAIDFHTEEKEPEYIMDEEFIPLEKDIFVMRHFENLKEKRHIHNFFEINYVMQGECRFDFEGEEKIMKRGEFCMIAPGASHDIIVTREDSVVITIAVRKTIFDSVFSVFLSQNNLLALFFRNTIYEKEKKNYLLFYITNEEKVNGIITNLTMENLKKDILSNTASVSWLILLFTVVMRNYSQTISYYELEKKNEFFLMIQYIQNNYQTVTLDQLAEFFHYTKPYVCALLKEHTGHTMTELLWTIRMKKAEELLINTSYSITQIAELVGYQTPESFSKIFHREHRMSPRQYRKENTLIFDSKR